MRFLFVMDPMSTVLTQKDTTFALMLAASAKGHECFHCLPLDVACDQGALEAKVARLHVQRRVESDGRLQSGEAMRRVFEEHRAELERGSGLSPDAKVDDGWKLEPAERAKIESFDVVLIRKDPPFDANYAYLTQLLDVVRGKTLLLNDPRGLREANEKLYALHFSRWTPRTIVTASPARIRDWVTSVGGHAVIKPLNGMAGAGIFLLRSDDRNFNAIVEATIGEEGRTWCMVQEYLPAAREGDKRILLLDGEPLGAILRVPREDEARANIHTGGSVVKSAITDHERAMIADMAPRLKQDGLVFVGLDVIGGKLTEVNVTSPTGIQQMMRLDGVDYAARVVSWIEKRVELKT